MSQESQVNQVEVPIQLLNGSSLPTYANADDAGCDIRCNLLHVPKGTLFLRPDRNGDPTKAKASIQPGECIKLPTGVHIAIPAGYVVLALPKSGRAFNMSLIIANSPGVIDGGYRGEICIIFRNVGQSAEIIEHGEKVAQLMCIKYEKMEFISIEDINAVPSDGRGSKGFGSTGVK